MSQKEQKTRLVLRSEFDKAVEAVWKEIQYQNNQNNLDIRTADEAKDVPGFLTLLRVYLRKAEHAWASEGGAVQPDGQIQVPEALNGLRKLAGIAIRAMIYNGVRSR